MNLTKSSFLIFIIFFLLLSINFPLLLNSLKPAIPFFLGLVMFLMGLTLKVSNLKQIIKQPSWVLVTVILQFTTMPIVSIIIVKVFHLSDELALGIIILGCCPGGTASNLVTYLSNGNVALSIVSTFLSTLIAVVLTPTLIFFLSNENIEINVYEIMKSAFLIVFFPVVAGILFRLIFSSKINITFLPKLSEIFIALIIGIIFSINIDQIKELSLKLFICILFHNLLGLLMGYLFATFFRFPIKERRTIAIEVGMQNSGLGMALSIIHFDKLVALPSALFSLWHNISAVGLVYLWKNK